MKKTFLFLAGLTLAACAHSPMSKDVTVEAWPSDKASFRQPASEVGVNVVRLDTNGGRRHANIEQCAGTASLVGSEGSWTLRIRNSDCANLEVFDRNNNQMEKTKLGGDGKGNRYIDVLLRNNSGRTEIFKVVIQSNSKKTTDIFYVTVRPRVEVVRPGEWMRLDDCGGFVVAKKGSTGQIHLNFKDVQYCHMFDIVGDEDGQVYYPAKEFPNSSASYTLPKSVTDGVFKRVLIQVRSRSGIIEDKFYVTFNTL